MKSTELQCIQCRSRFNVREVQVRCPRCGDLLEVIHEPTDYEAEGLRRIFDTRPLGVWRYREMLPLVGGREAYTLGEGGTPLHHCRRLGKRLGFDHLYVKNEGLNPTGSFKDRGMTLGVTVARILGAQRVVCASTGNTSASLAAYAGLAGMPCFVLVPSGKIALGKLAQAMVHGATVLAVEGDFDDAMRLVLEAAGELDLYLLNSVNPFRMEGQKTGAYELCDQLEGVAPDLLLCPVGNGNNIASYWKGFQEFHGLGLVDELPRMVGVQAAGASPIADAVAQGRKDMTPVAKPETVASAIRIGNPANWRKVLRAIYDSKGTALKVSDDEIVEAQGELARYEGLFVEPASASSLAGLKRMVGEGHLAGDEAIVLVTTGHGLKDPEGALRVTGKPREIKPTMEALRQALAKALEAKP